jgi:hypothetical protein
MTIKSIASTHVGESNAGRPGWIMSPASVRVESGRVLYTSRGGPRHRIRPALLESFVKLDTSAPVKVETFARKWGVLGVCRHNYMPLHRYWQNAYCQARSRNGMYWEPLELWTKLVARFRAVLLLAAAQQVGEKGTRADWAALGCDVVPGTSDKRMNTIQTYVNGQVLHGFVMPHVVSASNGKGFELEIQPYFNRQGCFGALAMQLALAVSRTEGFVNCSGCGDPFTVGFGRRRPNPNRRAYCDDCREAKVPEKDAAKAYRDSQKSKASS